MSLLGDKKEIINKIGAYTSLAESGKEIDVTNLLPSVNSKKDVVPYLMDMLGVVVGTDALKNLVGELFTSFVGNIEPRLKNIISKQLIGFNSGYKLPDSFKQGTKMSLKSIDSFGKFKNPPESQVGNLLYDNINSNFDSSVFDAIRNEGTDVEIFGLKMKYSSLDDSLLLKPTDAVSDFNIGEWTNNIIDKSKFMNETEFKTKVMNLVFGTVSKEEGKSVEDIISELEVNQLLEQVINGDDNFKISDDILDSIHNKAKEMNAGVVNYDMGCGMIQSEMDMDALIDLIDKIGNSDDPFQTSNDITSSLNDSFTAANEETTADENQETIKNGFYSKIIQFIKIELAKLLTVSPELRMLIGLISSFSNNGVVTITTPLDDLIDQKTMIKCLLKEILIELSEFIFNLVVGYLNSLITPVVKKFITERINQYLGIIKSLISTKL